jgi:hypothetical protein
LKIGDDRKFCVEQVEKDFEGMIKITLKVVKHFIKDQRLVDF